jgi:uncharacterized protein YjbI with pentapeptide repeats
MYYQNIVIKKIEKCDALINRNSKWIIICLITILIIISSGFVTQKFLFNKNIINLNSVEDRCNLEPSPNIDFRRCNFQGKEFVNVDLSYANLENSILLNTKFINVDLSYANLEKSQCGKAVFLNSDLSFANLKYLKCDDANFNNSTFHNADLTGGNLQSGDFLHTEMQNAILENSFLYKSDFSFANLTLANLKSTHLQSVNFTKTDLTLAEFDNAKFSLKELGDAIFDNCVGFVKCTKE